MLIRTSLLALDQAARLHFDIGDGLDLWLDDRRLGARQDDRDISLRLTGEGIPEELVAVLVRGQIGSTNIDVSLAPEPNLFFNHVWDGTSAEPDAPGTPVALVTELEVGWQLEGRFPRPHRTKWWKKPIIVGGVDMRSLGTGGITPDVVHQLDVTADILWRGNGTRLANAQALNPRHLSRLPIVAGELAVVDRSATHVFDAGGRFKRTLSTLRGHETVGAHLDERGRVTSWTSGGHRYTIDRRNDSEALLRSPAGVWAVIDFDDRGRAVMVTDQDRSKATLEWTSTGGLARVVDSAGLVTEIERDDVGRVTRFSDSTGRCLDLVRTTLASGSEVTVVTAEGRETRHRHERLEDGTYVESQTCCGAKSPRVIEHRSLGPLGEERIMRSPQGTTTTVRHSTQSDKLRAIEVSRTSIVLPSGKTMSVDRRTEWHRTGRTDEFVTIDDATVTKRLDPHKHTMTTRSAAGRDASAVLVPGASLQLLTPGLGSMKIEFDGNGRPRRRDRLGEVMTYGYDQNGRLTWTDFERWRQHLHHDEQGHVIAIETPDGWLQIARDPAGRVVAVKSPADSVTTINRRADGLISSIRYAEVGGESAVEEFGYDLDGLLVARQFSDDHHIGYERDFAGRVASVVTSGVKVTATYNDLTGQLHELASAGGDAVRFQYDGDLQWAEEATGRSPGRIERAFDRSRRLMARRVNGTHHLLYGRDADGLLTTVGPLQIERRPMSGLPVSLRVGGLTTTREYDAVGRLSRQETRYGKLAMVYFAEIIERDDFGRIAKITETVQDRKRVIEYGYNEGRRLERVSVDGEITMSLRHDENGNIVELDRQGRTLHLEVDAADKLIGVSGQPTTHDDAGNFTGIGLDSAVRGYRFDGLCRLIESSDSRHCVTHVLDPIGRPIRINGAGDVVRLLWDGDRLAATLDAQSNLDMAFIDAGTGAAPEALIRGGIEYLLITDHLGSVRAVVDSREGNIVQTLEYDALGRPTVNSAPGWQPFGFAGGLHESVGGIVRFGTRTYDPFTGRFLSRDPLGFAGGQTNLYQYALGDPVNNVDPTGMLVGPSGEINVCLDEFIGKRPLSVDHVYMRTRAWTRGVTPQTTLGIVGRLLTGWRVDPVGHDPRSRALTALDQTCPDEDEPVSPVLNTWTQSDLCFDPAWDALALAANPAPWQFVPTSWDEGPGFLDAVRWTTDLAHKVKAVLPDARGTLAKLADAMFD